jgi:hypothetical protein
MRFILRLNRPLVAEVWSAEIVAELARLREFL